MTAKPLLMDPNGLGDPSSGTNALLDVRLAGTVRQVLDGAGYHLTGLRELSGGDLALAPDPVQSVRWRRLTRRRRSVDVLVRLFLLRASADAADATSALGASACDTLRRAGLLRDRGGRVRAKLRLDPFDDLLTACDWPPTSRRPLRTNGVPGPGRASRTLASMTVRPACQRTLDLGTGTGVLAFLAARHSGHVVATDRNPRALAIASFNAALNDVRHISVSGGDLFTPVRGETFDLIVSNPPFVISPRSDRIYRDSGFPLDGLCQRISGLAPSHLSEGGFFQMLCNWAHVSGEPWSQRLRGWFEGSGCDVWVMRIATQDPMDYALQWLRDEQTPVELLAPRLSEWLRYFRQARVEAVGGGLITMRKRAAADGGNWFRCDEGPDAYGESCGEAILAAFPRHDWLAARCRAGDLLDQRLRVSPVARLSRQFSAAGGKWHAGVSALQLTRGLGYVCTVDDHVAAALGAFDGTRTLRVVIEECAASMGKPLGMVTDAWMKLMDDLVGAGMLIPVE